jgi:hypothetical protein
MRWGESASKIAAIPGDSVKTVVETHINLIPHDLGTGVGQGPAYDLEGDEV